MKKITAILLLALMLFNFAGYRLMFYCMQQKQSTQLVAKLDNQNYGNAGLITITLPLALPYQTDWKDFERADGEIQFQGNTYHYVKRKIENGNLILQCIADDGKMQLQSAKEQYADNANDLQNNNPSSKKQSDTNTNIVKLLTTDCIENTQGNSLYLLQNDKNSFAAFVSFHLPKGHSLAPGQPPEA